MNTNLALWDSLEKTDPKHTKAFTRGGGFKGTATNGTYIIKKLTEAFGPCGQGWRFVMEDERVEEGHTLKNGDRARVHIVRGHIAYRTATEWYQTSPQFGQTMMVDENKYGTFTDEEAPKKSITDCIAKCAVMLGIAADIHLGMFDDNKYVNERKREEAAKAANDAPEQAAPPPPPPATFSENVDAWTRDEAVAWAETCAKGLEGFTLAALDKWEARPETDKKLDRLMDLDRETWKTLKQKMASRRKALEQKAAA